MHSFLLQISESTLLNTLFTLTLVLFAVFVQPNFKKLFLHFPRLQCPGLACKVIPRLDKLKRELAYLSLTASPETIMLPGLESLTGFPIY